MKKLHVLGLLIVAVALGAIFLMSGNYTTYETFSGAEMQEGKVFNVVGELSEDMPMVYDPLTDPNYFEFYMIDREGFESKVVYHSPKPQDFERSEQIVVTGKHIENAFYADKILMKCPSKYVEDEVEFIEASAR